MSNNLLKYVISSGLAIYSAGSIAAMGDDPILAMVKADQLELRDADEGTVTGWEGHVWVGRDLNKFWFKTEGEKNEDETEASEFQFLYSRAIDANWDIQLGLKHDNYPEPSRDWAAVGFYGVAPYWFEIDTALFFDDDGQTNLRFEAEYEFMLTQKWVLSPEVEINAFGKSDAELGLGSGLSSIEAGLRLRYEITRKLAPYIGIHHERLIGDTADIADDAGEDTSETQLVAGIRFWF